MFDCNALILLTERSTKKSALHAVGKKFRCINFDVACVLTDVDGRMVPSFIDKTVWFCFFFCFTIFSKKCSLHILFFFLSACVFFCCHQTFSLKIRWMACVCRRYAVLSIYFFILVVVPWAQWEFTHFQLVYACTHAARRRLYMCIGTDLEEMNVGKVTLMLMDVHELDISKKKPPEQVLSIRYNHTLDVTRLFVHVWM